MNGALLLDKPLGVSSNFVLQKSKRLLGAKKAGHAGTLDPLASGLLIALFGEATKFAGMLLDSEKEYAATLKLGETTSTGDAEGKVLETKPVSVTDGQIRDALARFRGDIEQVPPMHSALKRDGVPLYKLARRGESVERAPRRVRILELELAAFHSPLLEIRVRCSKGTYVRTLAEDIGAALGTGAHLAALRRTGSGRFQVADAVGLSALEAMAPAERRARLLPVDSLLSQLPRVELDAAAEARLRNGQTLQMPALPEGVSAVYGPGGSLVGLGRAESGTLRPLRLTQVPEKG
jgi:tRNA pseudouridine55 synthase